MTFAAFTLAVLALLLAPGPTNSLMGVAGAEGGLRRVARLLPAELAGYVASICLISWTGAELVAHWPGFALVIQTLAAIWVMALAFMLWGRRAASEHTFAVTAERVLITTLLNPKALVFGLVLLPPIGDARFLPLLIWFCLMVVGVALLWGAFGRILTVSGGEDRLRLVQRLASVWLASVSIFLIAGAMRT